MVRFKPLWLGAGVAALMIPGIAGSAEGTVTRDLGWNGGDRFGVAMSAHTTFTQGPTAKIVVTGPKDIVDRIVIDDGVVRLRDHLGWTWYRYPPVTIVASAPHVREVTAAASARIEIGTLQEPSMSLKSSSSGSTAARSRLSP